MARDGERLLLSFLDDLISKFLNGRDDIGDGGEVVDLSVAHAELHRVIVTIRMFFLAELENFLRQCEEISLWLLNGHTLLKIGAMECWVKRTGSSPYALLQHAITPILHSAR